VLPPAADTAVRAALEATFRQRAYDRTVRETLWSKILAWLARLVELIRGEAQRSPLLTWALVAIVGAFAVLGVARWWWVARRRSEAAGGAIDGARGAAASDPWRVAATLAAAGAFTDAAHALYAALLARLARHERLSLHPSKTAGDYARDLRGLGSRAFAPFREFARDYDRVVYGLGTCDGAQFARLLDAANRTLPLGDAKSPRRG